MKYFSLILLSFFFLTVDAQDKDISNELDFDLIKKRKKILLISEASVYTVSLIGLNQLWYAGYPRSSFHFINDNKEWLQMDKVGHMTASYYTGVSGIQAYKWAGFSRKKAIWYGGMTGSIFLTVIEALDGTSKQWGASPGDLIANTAGSFLAVGQALKWNEQKILLKYSYSPSIWADQNPSQLGSNNIERALKDYNGQTYWLSFNVKSLFNIQSDNLPDWFNIAVGYGADGMLTPHQEKPEDYRKRQYLLSLDIDLTRIKTKNKVLNNFLHAFGFLKFPMPTIEITNGKLLTHSIYY